MHRLDDFAAALMVIENIAACEEGVVNSPAHNALRRIFRLAHGIRQPSCMPKHPTWVREFEAELEQARQAFLLEEGRAL